VVKSVEPIFNCIDSVRDADSPVTFWGNWIVKNCIILESGFGGISKTTFNYGLITSLMDDGKFLGVEGKQDLKVLYLDLESERSLIKSRLNLLGRLGVNHPYFYYTNKPDKTFKQSKPDIEKFFEKKWKPDLIFIDPYSLAFPSRNENDNAEATREMKLIRNCVKDWELTIILVSHSGKRDMFGAGHNRGASARPNLADITWNFHSMGLEYSSDLFIFDIPKNRWIHDGFFECISKTEGEFEVVPFPEGFEMPKINVGIKAFQLQDKIEQALADGKIKDKPTILEAMEMELPKHGSSEDVTFHRALSALMQRGNINKIARGLYQKAV